MTAPSPTSDPGHPSLLVFGATSAVGGYLLPLLREHAFMVTAVTRGALAPWHQRHSEFGWLQASLPDAPAPADDITHILSLGPCDLFVDWLAQQPPSPALRQVIAFGSTSAETKIVSDSADERTLAQNLQRSEAWLAAECARLGAAWTLLRPTLIYGADVDLVARIGRIAARWHVYPKLLGSIGRAMRQPVHAADLALAVIRAIDNPNTYDRRFDLAGQEALSLASLIQRAATAGGQFAVPLPLPAGPLLRIASAIGAIPGSSRLSAAALTRLGRDQVFDNRPAGQALGHAPRAFDPGSRR